MSLRMLSAQAMVFVTLLNTSKPREMQKWCIPPFVPLLDTPRTVVTLK